MNFQKLWGEEFIAPSSAWVPDKATTRRYKRSGTILGVLFGLAISVSSKRLCQLSTGSAACGFGSTNEAIIVSSFICLTMAGSGWYLGALISTEHPAFRRFLTWSFAFMILYPFAFPVILHQLQPQWKVDVWDEKLEDWAFLPLMLIYLAVQRRMKRNFERQQLKPRVD